MFALVLRLVKEKVYRGKSMWSFVCYQTAERFCGSVGQLEMRRNTLGFNLLWRVAGPSSAVFV